MKPEILGQNVKRQVLIGMMRLGPFYHESSPVSLTPASRRLLEIFAPPIGWGCHCLGMPPPLLSLIDRLTASWVNNVHTQHPTHHSLWLGSKPGTNAHAARWWQRLQAWRGGGGWLVVVASWPGPGFGARLGGHLPRFGGTGCPCAPPLAPTGSPYIQDLAWQHGLRVASEGQGKCSPGIRGRGQLACSLPSQKKSSPALAMATGATTTTTAAARQLLRCRPRP
jgi:hypothetical protein